MLPAGFLYLGRYWGKMHDQLIKGSEYLIGSTLAFGFPGDHGSYPGGGRKIVPLRFSSCDPMIAIYLRINS